MSEQEVDKATKLLQMAWNVLRGLVAVIAFCSAWVAHLEFTQRATEERLVKLEKDSAEQRQTINDFKATNVSFLEQLKALNVNLEDFKNDIRSRINK